MAKLGLVWNLRKASDKVVEAAKHRVKKNEQLKENALFDYESNDDDRLIEIVKPSKEHQH